MLFDKDGRVETDYDMYNNFFNFYLKEDLFPSFFIKDSGLGIKGIFLYSWEDIQKFRRNSIFYNIIL